MAKEQNCIKFLEVRDTVGTMQEIKDVFFFPRHSQNGKSMCWKQQAWCSHYEVEKNPEKPSYLSRDGSRATAGPNLSPQTNALSTALHCFPSSRDNQN